MKKIVICIIFIQSILFSKELFEKDIIIKEEKGEKYVRIYEKSTGLPFTGTLVEGSPGEEYQRKTLYYDGKMNGLDLLYKHGKIRQKNYYKNNERIYGEQYDIEGKLEAKIKIINGISYNESFRNSEYSLRIYDENNRVIGKDYKRNEYVFKTHKNGGRLEDFLNMSYDLSESKSFNLEGTLSKISYSVVNRGMMGLSRNYFPNGKIWMEMIFDNSLEEGDVIMYYPTGKISSITRYKKGRADGIGKKFYENGNLTYVGRWKDNKMVGVYKEYDENGNLFIEEIYDNGKLIQKIK